MSKVYVNDGYMMLLDAIYFNGKKIGKRVSKMVSLTICRGAVSGLLFSGIVAWLLRWFVPDKYLQGANQRFVTLLGTKSFMRIIESVQISNPLKPRESQKRKGS